MVLAQKQTQIKKTETGPCNYRHLFLSGEKNVMGKWCWKQRLSVCRVKPAQIPTPVSQEIMLTVEKWDLMKLKGFYIAKRRESTDVRRFL